MVSNSACFSVRARLTSRHLLQVGFSYTTIFVFGMVPPGRLQGSVNITFIDPPFNGFRRILKTRGQGNSPLLDHWPISNAPFPWVLHKSS
jgi:hypothetical protein